MGKIIKDEDWKDPHVRDLVDDLKIPDGYKFLKAYGRSSKFQNYLDSRGERSSLIKYDE